MFPLNPKAVVAERLETAFGIPSAQICDKLFKPDWNVIAAKQEERAGIIEKMIGEISVK